MRSRTWHWVMVLAVVSLCLLPPGTVPAAQAGDELQHDPPFLSASAGRDIELLAESQPGRTVSLWFRHHSDTVWQSVAARETRPGRYAAALPAAATRTPGVWYYFQSTGDQGAPLCTPEVFIQTCFVPGPDLCALSGDTVAYDIQYHGGTLPYGGTASTSSTRPTPAYEPVTSKLLELRTTGTNPHGGVDLGVYRVDVYAMQAGRVVCTAIGDKGSKFVVLGHGRQLHQNPDAYEYYSEYFHLEGWESGLDRGVAVAKGEKIGVSGDTGPGGYHLHFVFSVGDPAEPHEWTENRRRMPARYFFPGLSSSQWNYGRDLDFAQPPQSRYSSHYGTYVDIDAYPKGTTDSQTLTVTLHYRPPGGDWVTSDMNQVGTSSTYRGYFSEDAWNKTVEYYVKVVRVGVDGWITRPAQKYAAEPTEFYSVAVSPPQYPTPPRE